MGILNSLQAEIEKLNPANIVSEIEEARQKIEAYESRISDVEASLAALIKVAQQVAPLVETTFPQTTPEISALLATLKNLTLPAEPTSAS
jgi:chromosome segregation ATPase